MFAEKTILSQYIFQALSYEAHDPDGDGKGDYRLTVSVKHNRIPDDSIETAMEQILGKKVSILELYKSEKLPRIEYFLGSLRGWATNKPCLEPTDGQKHPSHSYHYFDLPEGTTEALSLCRRWKIINPDADKFEEISDPNLLRVRCCSTCIKVLEKILEKERIKKQGLKYDSRGNSRP